MCIRAYLNGDGSGYKTHLSLFFVLMKGEYDALLRWPFDYKVSMILVGKKGVRTASPRLEYWRTQLPGFLWWWGVGGHGIFSTSSPAPQIYNFIIVSTAARG